MPFDGVNRSFWAITYKWSILYPTFTYIIHLSVGIGCTHNNTRVYEIIDDYGGVGGWALASHPVTQISMQYCQEKAGCIATKELGGCTVFILASFIQLLHNQVDFRCSVSRTSRTSQTAAQFFSHTEDGLTHPSDSNLLNLYLQHSDKQNILKPTSLHGGEDRSTVGQCLSAAAHFIKYETVLKIIHLLFYVTDEVSKPLPMLQQKQSTISAGFISVQAACQQEGQWEDEMSSDILLWPSRWTPVTEMSHSFLSGTWNVHSNYTGPFWKLKQQSSSNEHFNASMHPPSESTRTAW